MCFRGSIVLWLVCSISAASQAEFYLKDGDTVVFYGDSITDQRLYTAFTEAFVVTRFPKASVRFIHSGCGGDRVDGGSNGPIDIRLKRDVIAYQPTAVTVMLGMNDGGYRAFDAGLFKSYTAGYEYIIKTLKTALPTARITTIEPSPYDDVTRPPLFDGGYNGVLTRYGAFVRELAAREGLLSADLNASIVDVLRRANQANPELAQKLIPDRVHPSAAISLIMAEALLKAWNAPPTVSEVVIDASSHALKKAANASVWQISSWALSKDDRVNWTQRDESLPMPMEGFPSSELTLLTLRSSDFADALNRETVTVSGLKANRRYMLKIDGDVIVTRSGDEWSSGVQLGQTSTPMSKQSTEVLQLLYRHNSLHWVRTNLILTVFEAQQPPSMDRALAAIDTLDDEVVAMARAKAQPKTHHYELVGVE